MFSKIFSFSNITLFVALALSTVAAWYSIIGLTAIFAGAVIPIIIMGSVLEVAKVTTTVWLRKYWKYSSWMLKIYLVPAVMALALMTSMGIFGFLSKAHMDQGIGTGDVAAKVAMFDEKIKIQRDNITANRAMLAQMDTQVNDIMSKGDSERAVERSVTIRKQQANERAKLLKDIEVSNTNIQKLNEERAPIASELRTAEAEVGPIKYIAAFIYGDNPDANLLERAVRWVIVLLVIVFDPLAILLVIGANQSKEWDKRIEEEERAELLPKYEPDDGPLTDNQIKQLNEIADQGIPIDKKVVEELDDPIHCYKCDTPLVDAPGIGLFCPNKECDVIDNTKGEEPVTLVEVTPEEEEEFNKLNKDPHPVGWMYTEPEPETVTTETVDTTHLTNEELMADTIDNSPDFEGVKDIKTGEWLQTGPSFEPKQPKPPKARVHGDYVEYDGQNMHKDVFIDKYPNLFLKEDGFRETKTSFGIEFPKDSNIGDSFVRVDVYPNRTFKYNGSRWIEVTRDTSDSHLTDVYLQYLVSKIATGEYDPELLTANEQDALENYIKKPNV
jgi:hypothetical protein